jgi:hypothetical protein
MYYDGTGFVIIMKRLERGMFSRINPFFGDEVVLTEAEFGLFFEGADLEKRFICRPKDLQMIDSPTEIKKSAFTARNELHQPAV